MSVIVLCPSCHEAVAFYRAPVIACPRCQARYPDAVRTPAERALTVELAPKPALLYVGQFGSTVAGALVLGFLMLAPFDLGTYSINHQVVSSAEFLRDGGGITFAIVGGLLAAIAVGLWRDRTWTRPLMLAYWLVTTVLLLALNQDLTAGDTLSAVVFMIVGLAVAAWYLYGKANVAAYFDARATMDRASAPAA